MNAKMHTRMGNGAHLIDFLWMDDWLTGNTAKQQRLQSTICKWEKDTLSFEIAARTTYKEELMKEWSQPDNQIQIRIYGVQFIRSHPMRFGLSKKHEQHGPRWFNCYSNQSDSDAYAMPRKGRRRRCIDWMNEWRDGALDIGYANKCWSLDNQSTR